MRAALLVVLVGCSSDLSGSWAGDCEFEDLVGPDGRFMELIYRVELDLETDASGAIEGDGMLFYAVSDVDLSSVLSVSGSRDGSAVELTLSFEEELNDLTLMGEQVASDRVEGDCAAGVAEGDFQLYR